MNYKGTLFASYCSPNRKPMDTTYLEDQIKQFETVVEDRQKKMDFMKRQQKEDKDILKQMKKSLQRLKNADTE